MKAPRLARGTLYPFLVLLLVLTTALPSEAQFEGEDCDPETAIIPCEEPPTATQTHPNPAIAACPAQTSTLGCTAVAGTGCWVCSSCAIYDSADFDCDAIPDSLERALAQRFFPHIYVRWFNSDLRQFYGYGVAESDRAIPFSVNVISGHSGLCGEAYQCLEIKYGIAYNWDCGDNPSNGCDNSLFGIRGEHRGDSEFYAAYVARRDPTGAGAWGVSWSIAKGSASYWRLMIDYASAHQGTSVDSSAYGLYLGITAPAKVYAAEGKHAMYHTPGFCDGGGFLNADHCVANYDLRGCYSSPSYCFSNDFLFNIGSSDQINYYNTKGSDGSTVKAWTYAPASRWEFPNALWGIYYFWGNGDFGDASAYRPKFETNLLWLTVHRCFEPFGFCGSLFSYNGRTGIRFPANDLFNPSCGCF